MGYDFQLYRYNSAGNLFGFVHYVLPGSPAERAGVIRGDVFTKINGTDLTVSNYMLLLNSNSYYLSFANISNHTIISNSKTSSSMTSSEIQENPIYFDTIYDVNSIKVGYLVYNGFMDNYDNQLNKVFKYFKDNGIQKLILDLRYNPGGSGDAATYLASMIYSTDTKKVFFKTSYNALLNSYFNNKYGDTHFNKYFADSIHASDITTGEPINSLGLTELYVIATGNSASASELIINGLRPHLSLTFIGDTTYGKYVGSTTFYDEDTAGKKNPDHTWALQPIIMKAININGVTDFNNGLFPDVVVPEDLSSVLPFGDINETLLSAAFDKIRGISRKKSFISNSFGRVASSKDFIPHSRELYFNNLKKGLKPESFKSSKKKK